MTSSFDLLVVSALSASGLGWYMRGLARMRRRIRWERENERTIFQVIEQAAVPNPYRIVVDDRGVVPFVAQTEKLADQLATLGYRDLGGVVTVFAIDHVIRGFVDPNGTHVAMVAANQNGAVVQIVSFGEDDTYYTRRGPAAGLAYPPSSHRQMVDLELGLADVIAKHKAYVPADLALLEVGATARLVELLVRNRKRAIAWRAQQPQDDLLDRDLRGLLGDENYRRFGPWFTRKLREPLPMATIKKR